jgi:hypothetical protein
MTNCGTEMNDTTSPRRGSVYCTDNKGYQTLTVHRNAVGAINRASLIGENFRPSPLKCEPGFLAILRGLFCGRRNFSAAH